MPTATTSTSGHVNWTELLTNRSWYEEDRSCYTVQSPFMHYLDADCSGYTTSAIHMMPDIERWINTETRDVLSTYVARRARREDFVDMLADVALNAVENTNVIGNMCNEERDDSLEVSDELEKFLENL